MRGATLVVVLLTVIQLGCGADRRARDYGDGEEVPEGCEGVTCSGHGRCATAGGTPVCVCDDGYVRDDLECVPDGTPPEDVCEGVTCNGHGTCEDRNGTAYCSCEDGYKTVGGFCVSEADPCQDQTCSGRGECRATESGPVCVCGSGYTPSNQSTLDCVPTESLCVGGDVSFQDETGESIAQWFEPNHLECEMFELINRNARLVLAPCGVGDVAHLIGPPVGPLPA